MSEAAQPFAMSPSVPSGMRLELSRARVLPGAEDLAREWMEILNRRQAECVKTLAVDAPRSSAGSCTPKVTE